MKTSKTTKRALLFSVLALVLCASMLIGSTFAWFTDTVATTQNKIIAGNLDVELSVKNGDSYDEVTAETNLFLKDALWEPGHVEVVNLKVANVGTLALKYQFGINIVNDEQEYTNALGTKFKLSDYIKFAVIDGEKTFTADDAGRAEAIKAAEGAEPKKLSEIAVNKDGVLYANGKVPEEGGDTEKLVTLIVYMPTTVDNIANYRDASVPPTINLGVTLVATQTPFEEDTFGKDYDKNAELPVLVSTTSELVNALAEGGDIELTEDVTLEDNTTDTIITKDSVIDLNGHTLSGAENNSALTVNNAEVVIKNGTIEATPSPSGAALYAMGNATVTAEDCTIKTNGNKTFAVCTNGAESLNSTIVIRNSIISAPTDAGAKAYALYAPAGNVTLENCNVTGHVFICGGNVTLDGGTYTATGFANQSKIWNKADTASYVSGSKGGTAFNMGDSILIADRRSGYTLSSVTIRNITFNTEITLKDGTKAVSYGIKYVDMAQNGAAGRANLVIENNTFNNQIDGANPEMYIDLTGADITNP